VPNQEKVINRVNRVTYHDKAGYMRMILLPIRELMQAHFAVAADNCFRTLEKQERESQELQNETVLESGCLKSPFRGFLIALPRDFRPGFLLRPP
jgi:hypothetical protein